jgi:hypothetical protein
LRTRRRGKRKKGPWGRRARRRPGMARGSGTGLGGCHGLSFCSLGSEDLETAAGVGVEGLVYLFQWELGQLVCDEGEEGVAQESEIGECVGIAGAGAVFPPDGVTPPVIADFHSAPMAANEVVPFFGRVIVGRGV